MYDIRFEHFIRGAGVYAVQKTIEEVLERAQRWQSEQRQKRA
jgi:hypothetical protein